MKLMLIFGTRPEAIKMASIIEELKKFKSQFKVVICVTAQHREMLDQVLRIFRIHPDYDLKVMNKGQDLFDITTNCLNLVKDVLVLEKPDFVIVQGDTTSAIASALAAFYCRIPIAHVEAGLRTHNKYSPFPEEVNRGLLSVLADVHFAPTGWAKSNLLKEGVPVSKIFVTGNTVVDALLTIKHRQRIGNARKSWKSYFKEIYNLDILEKDPYKKLILVTGHRRENFGKSFNNICLALKKIAERRDVVIVYPVHLNPNVQLPVKTILGRVANIYLIEPLEYEGFIYLMDQAYLILTDSGGIQEEAPSLGKPVLVMRDTTERPEGVREGVVKLVGTSKKRIVHDVSELLDNKGLYRKMSRAVNPYGDGKAAEKIVSVFKNIFIKNNKYSSK